MRVLTTVKKGNKIYNLGSRSDAKGIKRRKANRGAAKERKETKLTKKKANAHHDLENFGVRMRDVQFYDNHDNKNDDNNDDEEEAVPLMFSSSPLHFHFHFPLSKIQ
jgi:hypothetical protein